MILFQLNCITQNKVLHTESTFTYSTINQIYSKTKEITPQQDSSNVFRIKSLILNWTYSFQMMTKTAMR
jgi:hypothetical protein